MLQCYQMSVLTMLPMVIWFVLMNIRIEPLVIISRWPDKHGRAEKGRNQAMSVLDGYSIDSFLLNSVLYFIYNDVTLWFSCFP